MKKIHVSHQMVNKLWKGPIKLEDFSVGPFYPNMSIVLKCIECESHSALGRVSKNGEVILKVPEEMSYSGISPRNKEQKMLMDCLFDDDVTMNIITGHAGTGKTICATAVALTKLLDTSKYDSIIFTKPMTSVGNMNLGAVPGDLREKYDPYLLSFYCNLEILLSKHGLKYLDLLEDEGKIKWIPVSVMRGASFSNSFIVADEVQSFSPHELKTLCTRIGEGSKIVLMGDPSQRDSDLTWEETGLYRLINSLQIKESPLTSYIELIKGCRSPLADLVAEVL